MDENHWYLGCEYTCRLCNKITFLSSLPLLIHVSKEHNVSTQTYTKIYQNYETKLEYFKCALCDTKNIKKCYKEVKAHLFYLHKVSLEEYESNVMSSEKENGTNKSLSSLKENSNVVREFSDQNSVSSSDKDPLPEESDNIIESNVSAIESFNKKDEEDNIEMDDLSEISEYIPKKDITQMVQDRKLNEIELFTDNIEKDSIHNFNEHSRSLVDKSDEIYKTEFCEIEKSNYNCEEAIIDDLVEPTEWDKQSSLNLKNESLDKDLELNHIEAENYIETSPCSILDVKQTSITNTSSFRENEENESLMETNELSNTWEDSSSDGSDTQRQIEEVENQSKTDSIELEEEGKLIYAETSIMRLRKWKQFAKFVKKNFNHDINKEKPTKHHYKSMIKSWFENTMKPTSMSSYVSLLASVHKLKFKENPLEHFPEINKKINEAIRNLDPIKHTVFKETEIKAFLELDVKNNPQKLWLQAVLILGIFGGLGAKEIQYLKWENIEKTEFGSIEIIISKLKPGKMEETYTETKIIPHENSIARKFMLYHEHLLKHFGSEYVKDESFVIQKIFGPYDKTSPNKGVTRQLIGQAPQEIAKILGLKNADTFTGSSFKETSKKFNIFQMHNTSDEEVHKETKIKCSRRCKTEHFKEMPRDLEENTKRKAEKNKKKIESYWQTFREYVKKIFVVDINFIPPTEEHYKNLISYRNEKGFKQDSTRVYLSALNSQHIKRYGENLGWLNVKNAMKEHPKEPTAKTAISFTEKEMARLLSMNCKRQPQNLRLQVVAILAVFGKLKKDEIRYLKWGEIENSKLGKMTFVYDKRSSKEDNPVSKILMEYHREVKKTLGSSYVTNESYVVIKTKRKKSQVTFAKTREPIEISFINQSAQKVANLLGLKNPNSYTGHSWRVTSKTFNAFLMFDFYKKIL